MICEGCGQQEFSGTKYAEGPWAGRWLCRACDSRRRRRQPLPRLTYIVSYTFKAAELLPPADRLTVPIVRLLMAVDDVRRAQLDSLEAHRRINLAPRLEKARFFGDWVYAIRRLCSHLHEGGVALRRLDTIGARRVDEILTGATDEARAALSALRVFFNSAEYAECFVSKVRNLIGFHYDDAEIVAMVTADFTEEAIAGATALQMGGLARTANSFVVSVLNRLAGDDLLVGGEVSKERIRQALKQAGYLTVFVDHLFERLLRERFYAVVDQEHDVIEIPPLVRESEEIVDETRARGEIDA